MSSNPSPTFGNDQSVNISDSNAEINSQKTLNNQFVPVNKWSTQNVLEWLSKKAPLIYEFYKESFVQNQINGEVLLEYNDACLDYMNIYDSNLRDQLMDEIALLKIKNDYEFIKRFRSQTTN